MQQRGWMFLLVVALVTACSGVNSPVAPVAANNPVTPVPPSPPQPASPPVVPGTTPPAGIYAFADTGAAVASYTRASRFVLADDGRFALRYENIGNEYRGTYTYTEATGRITFAWEGWSLAGPWEATGLLQGEVLTVSFNSIMQLTDFENATYTRVP